MENSGWIGKLAILLLLVLAGSFLAAQSRDVPLNLVNFVQEELAAIGRDPVVVEMVGRQNSIDTNLQDIRQRDEIWKANSGIDRFMMDLMSNECALVLHNYECDYPFIVETFAMDSLGANVGQTTKTSDYWQGDEAKFTESYKDGRGEIYYGDVEYDDSVNEIIVQVSIPVMSDNRAIGAITFGISLDRWERR